MKDLDAVLLAKGSLSAASLLARQQRLLESIAVSKPLGEILNDIARYSEDVTPQMLASILVFEPGSGRLRKGGYGRLPDSFQNAIDGMVPGPKVGSCGTAAYLSQRVISRDVQQDPLWEPFREFAAQYGIASAWSTPLRSRDGELLGVFGMYYGDLREPSADDLDLVDYFTHLAAIAIENWRRDADLRHHATRDLLTGVANRQSLNNYVDDLSRNSDFGVGPAEWAVALVDVDYFRLHNALLGRRNADALLVSVSRRIQDAVGSDGFVARIGGDQFIVLLPDPSDGAAERLDAIVAAGHAPIELGDQAISPSLSLGWVRWSPVAQNFDSVLDQCLNAARDAKRLGRNRQIFFDDSKWKAAERNRRVYQELSSAMRDGRVEPLFQPIVDLASGRVSSFEVLARIRAISDGQILPEEFIPVAEESGLIEALGVEVMRYALSNYAKLRGDRRELKLNVNVSIRQLLNRNICANFVDMAREYGVDPRAITIEVTESSWLDVNSPVRLNLLELKAAGFPLALDDLGTGYASFSFLRSLPFDHVKIDKSFVDELTRGEQGQVFCEAMIAMAKALNIGVTAEGVETESQAAALKKLGCGRGQGYYWSKPLTLDAAARWNL